MATRNRVIYQSESVYVSQDVSATGVQTGDRDIAALHRVQSANYSFSISRQDVNCFGELARIDSIITDTPTVSFDASYYLPNLGNENKLGFHIWADTDTASASNTPVSCISGIINSATNDGVKNYYILTTTEGSDSVSNTESGKYESIIGIGNASITSYSTEAAVGGLPTVSFSAEGQNMNMVSVNPTVNGGGTAAANAGFTGFYDGYTGYGGAAEDTSDRWFNRVGMGNAAGFEIAGTTTFKVTGSLPTVGSNKTINIVGTTANKIDGDWDGVVRTGISATIPAGTQFTNGGSKTITLDQTLQKDAYEFKGTVAGGAPIPTDVYTANLNNVVTYISGGNPSIDTTDGSIADWSGFAPDGSLKLNTTNNVKPIAPIKLPVATQGLTTSGVNTTGDISTLRPGDITLTLTKSDGSANELLGATFNDVPIQSYTISFDLSRTPIEKLGSKYAFARPVDFPITASLSVDALVNDLTTGSVADIITCDDEYNATVILKKAATCGADSQAVMSYEVKKIKLDSESYSSSIGDNKTVTYDFSCQIGGPDQNDIGVFMSGYYTGIAGLWD